MQMLKYLKKVTREKGVFDIVIFGSFVKQKEKPRDVDTAIIFEKEDYDYIDKVSARVAEIIRKYGLEPHIEPLIINKIFKEPLFLTLIHEGLSLKYNKFIYKMLGVDSLALVTYSLQNLSRSKKTMFGYALKGRETKNGLLGKLKGAVVGRNSFYVPIESVERAREFLKIWNVEYKVERLMRPKTYI